MKIEILERFKKILRGKYQVTVIECGMCDGFHSDLMLQIIKDTDRPYIFHGFEPNKELHQHIQNNLKGHLMHNNGVIGIFPHAIGAEVGEMSFYKSGGVELKDGRPVDWYYGSSSIKKPKLIKDDYPTMTFEEEKVFVTTLDHHCSQHKIGLIDFIWSDIQGAEVDMIQGGKETFKNVRYLYTEYLNKEHYEGQVGLGDILKLLPDFTIIEDYNGDILLKNMNY